MTATTALTAQNTLGVQDIHHTPPDFVRKQIDAVCEDVGVDVVKTGRMMIRKSYLVNRCADEMQACLPPPKQS
jgi:hydroxymethylpyrimidine/phosphomethylpyrimidine kinase